MTQTEHRQSRPVFRGDIFESPTVHGRDTSRPVIDRMARLHLRNSARLERLNSLGNISPMG